jgi:hypothetical protein
VPLRKALSEYPTGLSLVQHGNRAGPDRHRDRGSLAVVERVRMSGEIDEDVEVVGVERSQLDQAAGDQRASDLPRR